MTTPSPSPLRRKAIFDTIRSILKRGFRQSEVERIDAALDATGPGTDTPSLLPQDSVPCVPTVAYVRRTEAETDRAVSARGIALIKRFEGCARLRRDGMIEAYPDPASALARTGSGSGDPWTIGWGATGRGLDGAGMIGPGTLWSQAQCDQRLEQDLERYAAGVARAIGDTPTTQGQFDAMVSFHYNTGAIARATLTRKHNACDYDGAAQEFARWNKAGGRVLRGLVRRRAAEAELYRAQ